jgi:hypothetical protein
MDNLLLNDYTISFILFILSIIACILLVNVKSHQYYKKKHSNKINIDNITPEQKALNLVNKFQPISGFLRFSKAYASITIDEIIETLKDCSTPEEKKNYWIEVKKEIEKL